MKPASAFTLLHISTKEEIEFLRDHKDVTSCEATPHHLTLVAPECYERLGTRAQMNPPVRSADHRDGIWRGIEQGIIDVLGSDSRAAYAGGKSQKPIRPRHRHDRGADPCVPLMLDHVNAGRLSLARFVDLTSAGPARLYNIATKGRIAAGYDCGLHGGRSQAQRRPSPTNGWPRAPAGHRMTGCVSPAGRSAPLCAAAA